MTQAAQRMRERHFASQSTLKPRFFRNRFEQSKHRAPRSAGSEIPKTVARHDKSADTVAAVMPGPGHHGRHFRCQIGLEPVSCAELHHRAHVGQDDDWPFPLFLEELGIGVARTGGDPPSRWI